MDAYIRQSWFPVSRQTDIFSYVQQLEEEVIALAKQNAYFFEEIQRRTQTACFWRDSFESLLSPVRQSVVQILKQSDREGWGFLKTADAVSQKCVALNRGVNATDC